MADKTGDEPGRDAKGRFVKGNRANPNGRPPAAFSFTELLRAKVAERPSVLLRIIELCDHKDPDVALKAMKIVSDRIEGLPRQSIETSTADSDPWLQLQRKVLDGPQA